MGREHSRNPRPFAMVHSQLLRREPPKFVIRIRPGGHRDPDGLLRSLTGGRDGWIQVRPDAYVAWVRHDRDGMEAAVRQVLGEAPGR